MLQHGWLRNRQRRKKDLKKTQQHKQILIIINFFRNDTNLFLSKDCQIGRLVFNFMQVINYCLINILCLLSDKTPLFLLADARSAYHGKEKNRCARRSTLRFFVFFSIFFNFFAALFFLLFAVVFAILSTCLLRKVVFRNGTENAKLVDLQRFLSLSFFFFCLFDGLHIKKMDHGYLTLVDVFIISTEFLFKDPCFHGSYRL